MDPLSNLTSIRGDVIELWNAPAKKYLGIQELVLGIPPASMNTLEKVAAAIGNDPDYFETIAAGLDSKADLSFVNEELADKADLVLTALELETKADQDLLTSELAKKTDLSLTTSELAKKATTSSVTALAARIANTERVVTVDPDVTFNYLETGEDALVIRGANLG
jgi:hypothetical protein